MFILFLCFTLSAYSAAIFDHDALGLEGTRIAIAHPNHKTDEDIESTAYLMLCDFLKRTSTHGPLQEGDSSEETSQDDCSLESPTSLPDPFTSIPFIEKVKNHPGTHVFFHHGPKNDASPTPITAHYTETAEDAMAVFALDAIGDISDKTCVCTTLESSAALAGPLADFNLQAHVGLSAGCVGHKNPQYQNDFSQIIAENKSAQTFIFVQTDCNADYMWEFLTQLRHQGRKQGDGSADIIFCLNMIWGKHDLRFEKGVTHAHIVAYNTIKQNDFTALMTQHPNNHLVINFPDLTKCEILQNLGKAPQSALQADVLIGSPQQDSLSRLDKSCIFGCSIRVFRKLYEQDTSVRYVFAQNPSFHCETDIIDTKERVLLCAGPQEHEHSIMPWALDFIAKSQALYDKIFFVPCNSCNFDRSMRAHDFPGEFYIYPL